MVECPKCGRELNQVRVVSTCVQTADVEDGKITEYGSVDDIFETEYMDCKYCGARLPDGLIKES